MSSVVARAKYQFEITVLSVREVAFETKSHAAVKVIHPMRPSLTCTYKSKPLKSHDYNFKMTHTCNDIDALGIDVEIYYETGLLKSNTLYGSTGPLGAVAILLKPIQQLWFPIYDNTSAKSQNGQVLLSIAIVESPLVYISQGEFNRVIGMVSGAFGSKIIHLDGSSNVEDDYIYGGHAISDWCAKFSLYVDVVSTSLNVLLAGSTNNPSKSNTIIANIQYRRKEYQTSHQQMTYEIPQSELLAQMQIGQMRDELTTHYNPNMHNNSIDQIHRSNSSNNVFVNAMHHQSQLGNQNQPPNVPVRRQSLNMGGSMRKN